MLSVSSTGSRKNKSKLTIESLPVIDIKQLCNKVCISDNIEGTLIWKIGAIEICSISYTIYEDKILLNYKHRLHNNHWKPVKREILFDYTRCNYGGKRTWFVCNGCGRRVGVLCYLAGEFLCRHCHNLCYASQREKKDERLIRKVRKIRQKLGASDNIFEPIWDKPRYMHQSTFDRLQKEANDAHNLSWEMVEKRFAKYT